MVTFIFGVIETSIIRNFSSTLIHAEVVPSLCELLKIPYRESWHNNKPTSFLCVQRLSDSNEILLSESYDINDVFLSLSKLFIEKAKTKNDVIFFINKQI
jgi:hypothetical protein